MKILVTGDRNWTDYEMIFGALAGYMLSMPDEYPSTFIRVIHGAARGADTLAGQAARNMGAAEVPYPAQWDKYGRSAGPIRNEEMFDEEQPDVVLAFHDDLRNSKGTRHMVTYAVKAETKTLLYRHKYPVLQLDMETLKECLER